MKKSNRLLCLIIALLLLSGCSSAEPNGGDHSDETGFQEHGKVTVYSEQQYKMALMQRFSHINLTENIFSVEWVDNMERADIVITNRLESLDYNNYRVLDVQQLDVQPMEQLLIRDDRGVIGLPVFLRLTGFWYDELLYQNSDLTVPQSMETWKQFGINTEYPAVCEVNDSDSLLWGVVAPLYLYYNGTVEELTSGQLQHEPLSKALLGLQEIVDHGLLQLTEDSRQRFTSTQAAFWLASNQQIAASYNFMSNRSKFGFSSGVILPASELSKCVVRADVIFVHQNADPVLTDLFLKRFFQEQTLVELSCDTQMPVACQVQYGPSVVPELAQMCYTVLSSPSVEIIYISCGWSDTKEASILHVLQSLLDGGITAEQATDMILQ